MKKLLALALAALMLTGCAALPGEERAFAVVDMTAKPAGNPRMEQLMKFGRDHSDIIKIKK